MADPSAPLRASFSGGVSCLCDVFRDYGPVAGVCPCSGSGGGFLLQVMDVTPAGDGEREERMGGAVSYHAGLAAEHQVAAYYERAGRPIAAHRWRGRYGGEIDLIARDGDTVIFIEVKRAKCHAWAAERVSRRQIERIFISAQEFIGREMVAANLNIRFDVALVDAAGQIEILENAFYTG